jgi:hypothetical protein
MVRRVIPFQKWEEAGVLSSATELLNPFQKHLYTHVLGRADTADRLHSLDG